jgi:uncharacterized protein
MKALAALLLSLALAGGASAAPAAWTVRDADSEMVLVGSVHLLPPGLPWKTQILIRAIARADDVWFELEVSPEVEREAARLAREHGLLPPDASLYTLLPAEDAQRLARVARGLGVDPMALARLEPWLAEVSLAAGAYARSGATVGDGVEQTLVQILPKRAARRALETPAEQIEAFDAAPLSEQVESLGETLRELETDPDGYTRLIDAWMSGDPDALDREALAPLRAAAPAAYRRLVVDRNARWIPKLEERLRGRGRTVVVVGAGHLVGPDGLPARLRALGYSVTGP